MGERGIGPQGLGKKGNNGFWVGSPSKKDKAVSKETLKDNQVKKSK